MDEQLIKSLSSQMSKMSIEQQSYSNDVLPKLLHSSRHQKYSKISVQSFNKKSKMSIQQTIKKSCTSNESNQYHQVKISLDSSLKQKNGAQFCHNNQLLNKRKQINKSQNPKPDKPSFPNSKYSDQSQKIFQSFQKIKHKCSCKHNQNNTIECQKQYCDCYTSEEMCVKQKCCQHCILLKKQHNAENNIAKQAEKKSVKIRRTSSRMVTQQVDSNDNKVFESLTLQDSATKQLDSQTSNHTIDTSKQIQDYNSKKQKENISQKKIQKKKVIPINNKSKQQKIKCICKNCRCLNNTCKCKKLGRFCSSECQCDPQKCLNYVKDIKQSQSAHRKSQIRPAIFLQEEYEQAQMPSSMVFQPGQSFYYRFFGINKN